MGLLTRKFITTEMILHIYMELILILPFSRGLQWWWHCWYGLYRTYQSDVKTHTNMSHFAYLKSLPIKSCTHSLNILTWNRFWYCQFHGGCNDGNFVCMLSTMCDVNCIIVTKNTTIQLMFSGHELYWVIIFFRWCVRDVSFFCCDCDYYHYHNTTHILLTWIIWCYSAILHIARMCHFINMR